MRYVVCAIEKEENERNSEYVPCTVMQVQYVQGREMEKPMMILFDPGSTRSYVKQQILPAGATPRLHREELLATTLSGESRTNRSVEPVSYTHPTPPTKREGLYPESTI